MNTKQATASAASFTELAGSDAALVLEVKISADLASVDVMHDGRRVTIMRNQDQGNSINPEYAKTSCKCLPLRPANSRRACKRSIKEELFVAVGICTNLGCVPDYEPDGRAEVQHALFFCPCHGSEFDLAGRVFKGQPAPTNLIIPPHQYLDNGMLEIGDEEQTS